MDHDRLTLALGGCLLVLTLFACGLSFAAGRYAGRKNAPVLPAKPDTLIIVHRDTIRVRFPVPSGSVATFVQFVPVTDTVTVHDTLYVAVEMERKTYEGDDYRAVVSGWRPTLEEIAVFPKTVYIQPPAVPAASAGRRPRAGLGITAGPGAFWTPQAAGVQFGAGAVVGLSLTF